jgi:hypothetical protein
MKTLILIKVKAWYVSILIYNRKSGSHIIALMWLAKECLLTH